MRWNDYANNKIQRRMVSHLKSLESKGYLQIQYIDKKPKYVFIKPILSSFRRMKVPKELVHNRRIKFNQLVLVCYLATQAKKFINYNNYISERIGIDRHTVSKYCSELEYEGFIERRTHKMKFSCPNFGIKDEFAQIVATRLTRVHNSVDGHVRKTPLTYIYRIYINRRLQGAKKIKGKLRMKSIDQYIDLEKLVKRDLITGIQLNLHQLNIKVSDEDIEKKMTELYLSYQKKGVKKFFDNDYRFISFITSMFRESYGLKLSECLANVDLLESIQKKVKTLKDMIYDINFIRWLAKQIFKDGRLFKNENEFELLMLVALKNELRSGASTDGWDVDFIYTKEIKEPKGLKRAKLPDGNNLFATKSIQEVLQKVLGK